MPRQPDETFLLRWSRRKRASRLDETEPASGERAQTESPPPSSGATGHQDPVADRVDGGAQASTANLQPPDEIPDDLKDVDIDALDYEADFKRFLEKDVPDALRRRALRQLWRTDPVLANIDGLNDYDDDFTDAALAVKVLETVHKVGRGYLEDDAEEEEVGEGGDVTASAEETKTSEQDAPSPEAALEDGEVDDDDKTSVAVADPPSDETKPT